MCRTPHSPWTDSEKTETMYTCISTHIARSEVRPSNTPSGSAVIWLFWRLLQAHLRSQWFGDCLMRTSRATPAHALRVWVMHMLSIRAWYIVRIYIYIYIYNYDDECLCVVSHMHVIIWAHMHVIIWAHQKPTKTSTYRCLDRDHDRDHDAYWPT